MSDHHDIALLGLPQAGKTSWLGRLWLALDRPPYGSEPPLTKAGQPDLEALNALSDSFIDGEYPKATPFVDPPRIRVPVRWKEGAQFDVRIADYSGEEIKAIHRERDAAWSEAWERRSESSSLMVFIRPAHHIDPTSTRLVPERMLQHVDQAGQVGREPLRDSEGGNLDGWLTVPTAVAIVELMQFFRFLRGWSPGFWPDPKDFRVAVCLSCWDAVAEEDRCGGPAGYMRERLGLLDDFLSTNFHPGGVRAFGVSATGGDLRDAAFQETYAEKYPEDWGSVQWSTDEGVGESDDLATPLSWLLVGDEALDAG